MIHAPQSGDVVRIASCRSTGDDFWGATRPLQRSGAAQRHAFVVVPTFSTVPPEVTDLLWSGENGPVPVAVPPLPPQVTHVWFAPTWSIGSGLRWTPGEGWTRFPTLNGSPPQ